MPPGERRQRTIPEDIDGTIAGGASPIVQPQWGRERYSETPLPGVDPHAGEAMGSAEELRAMEDARRQGLFNETLQGKASRDVADAIVGTAAIPSEIVRHGYGLYQNVDVGDWKGAAGSVGGLGLAAFGIVGLRGSGKPFYSAAENAVRASKMEAATGEQWYATLKNSAFVKDEELAWTGTDYFLTFLDRKKQVITKDELVKHLSDNGIELREVWKGPQPLTPEESATLLKNQMVREQIISERAQIQVELSQVREILRNAELKNMLRRDNGLAPDPLLTEKASEANRRFNSLVARYGELNDQHIDVSKNISSIETKLVDDTRHGTSQLAGGTNYRELLLIFPRKQIGDPPPRSFEEIEIRAREMVAEDARQRHGGPDWDDLSPQEREGYVGAAERQFRMLDTQRMADDMSFRSPHFPEKGILVHLRMNDRVGLDGKRTLFIEEIQSDLQQAGHKFRYRYEPKPIEEDWANIAMEIDRREPLVRNRPHTTEDYYAALRRHPDLLDKWREMYRLVSAPPDAPFKGTSTWSELALKRILRHAADNGYERVAWIKGEDVAARFPAESRGQGTVVHLAGDNPETINLLNKQPLADPGDWVFVYDRDGSVSEPFKSKAAVEGWVNGSARTRGLMEFYDKILPASARNLVNKYGMRVGESEVSSPVGEIRVHSVDLIPEMKQKEWHLMMPPAVAIGAGAVAGERQEQ